MPLGPYMMQSVVRIIGDKRNKKTQLYERAPLGTGFYIQVPSEGKDGWYGYLVTAHHVVDGQPKLDLAFPDPYDPGALYPLVPTSGPDWLQPLADVDLAVLPFARPDKYFINALQLGMHLWEHLPGDAMLAMPFHYVGLLEPLNRPMARSGTLGAIYQSGIAHRDGYVYDCHLGDSRSYGGFSGSPCFLEIAMPGLEEAEPPVPLPDGAGPVGRFIYLHLLCGMVTWHLEPPVDRDESSIFGVVVMLTSDDIWRALMADDLADDRRRRDAIPDEPEAVARNLSAVGGRPETASEFDSFEDLTDKLLRVPKSELDEKLKESGS